MQPGCRQHLLDLPHLVALRNPYPEIVIKGVVQLRIHLSDFLEHRPLKKRRRLAYEAFGLQQFWVERMRRISANFLAPFVNPLRFSIYSRNFAVDAKLLNGGRDRAW